MATASDEASQPARRSKLPIIIGGVVIWAVLLVLSVLLWQTAFDFTREEAWMLSVALFVYLGLFIIAMVAIAGALGSDH